MDDLEPVPANDLPAGGQEEVPAHDIPAGVAQSGSGGEEVPAADLPEAMGGTPGTSSVGAAFEGVAKGLAGPVATGAELALSKLGVPGLSAVEQTQREAEHPLVEGAGQAVGLVVPAIITGGASAELRGAAEAGSLGLEAAGGAGALSKAAGYTLPGVLGGVGNKAAQAAAKSLEIGKAGQMAIKLGLEGGLFKVSDNASKMILGQTDPEAPVASLLAGIGASALLGGGLGFVGGKAGAKLQEMAEGKAGQTASKWLADLGSRFNLIDKHGGMEGTTEAGAEQAQHLYDTVSAAV